MKKSFFPLIIVVVLLICRLALAGNAKSFPMGDNASMTAETVSAVTRDSEAIWYNPAGLGGNQYSRLNLSGNVFMIRFQNIPDGMTAVLRP